jgi:hypothetical protein
LAAGIVLVPLALTGCGRQANAPAPVMAKAPAPSEPGEIELSDPKVTMTDEDRVHFEVSYRFVKGRPEKHYMCDVSFPGTPNHAAKPMSSFELKEAGVIKDSCRLFKPPATTFEIRMSEADSPMNGFKLISNVVRGPVKANGLSAVEK